MLDKPIIAVVVPGARVPERLIRVADAIIEADMESDEGKRALQGAIQAALAELRPE